LIININYIFITTLQKGNYLTKVKSSPTFENK